MEKQYHIEGISCMSCVTQIEKALYSNEQIEKVNIDKDSGNTILTTTTDIPFDTLSSLVASAGDYSLNATKVERKESKLTTYKPLLLVAGFLILSTAAVEWSSGMFLWETWMANFMAGFFIVFSFFKFLDIRGFASAYATYDIIAARSKAYGLAFPFIELGLGMAYIVYPDEVMTHTITAVVMFVSLIGVVRSVLNKSEIKCACLGTGFNLPMSFVTIVEDSIMLGMALVMLIMNQ